MYCARLESASTSKMGAKVVSTDFDVNSQLEAFYLLALSVWGEHKTAYEHAEKALTLGILPGNKTDDDVIYKSIQLLFFEALENTIDNRYFDNPYYRLSTRERIILMGLHKSSLNYKALGLFLKTSQEGIEIESWRARLSLLSQPELKNQKYAVYPGGVGKFGASCPVFAELAPWTQRFLDNAITIKERVFLESHLNNCEDCLKRLEASKKAFYLVDSFIPSKDIPDFKTNIQHLMQAWVKMNRVLSPINSSFMDSVQAFFRRFDARFASVMLVILIMVWLFR